MDDKFETGRLIIYVSFAPAAGKSKQMLLRAKKLLENGFRVNVASANWKNRKETELLSKELWGDDINCEYSMHISHINYDVLSSAVSDYVIFDEASFEDEKNNKIYEVIIETLKKGISVLTTINIQKFTEVNEKCRILTHINIKNTIPISFLEFANEIWFVDENIDRLITMYKAMAILDKGIKYLTLKNLNIYRRTAKQIMQNPNKCTLKRRNDIWQEKM